MADTGELSFENQLRVVWEALNKVSELLATQAQEIADLRERIRRLEAERLPTQPLS